MPHSLQLLLLLSLIVIAAKVSAALANRVGQPAVFGEILAGLLLGPTVLNMLAWRPFAAVTGPGGVTVDLLSVLGDFAEIGVLLLMFVAGLETNIAEIRRVGRAAFWSVFGGVLFPLVGGTAAAVLFGLPLYWDAIFVGTILTATSVSLSAQTLLELGALRSREGSTILGAAVIDDVMGILVLSFVVAFAGASGGRVDVGQIALVVLRVCSFLAAAILAAGGCPVRSGGPTRWASVRVCWPPPSRSPSSTRGRPSAWEAWQRSPGRTSRGS